MQKGDNSTQKSEKTDPASAEERNENKSLFDQILHQTNEQVPHQHDKSATKVTTPQPEKSPEFKAGAEDKINILIVQNNPNVTVKNNIIGNQTIYGGYQQHPSSRNSPEPA